MATGKNRTPKGPGRNRRRPRKSAGNDPSAARRKPASPPGDRGRARASDPVAERIKQALAGLENDPEVRLGTYGYTVRRARGRGGPDFVAWKNVKP